MRFQSVQSIIWLQMIWNMKHKTYGLRLWYFYDGFSFFVELDSLLLNEKELYTAGYRVCKSMMVKKVKYWKDKSTPHIFNSRICCGFWSLHRTQRYGNLSDVYRGQNLLQTSAVDQGSDTRGSRQGLNSLSSICRSLEQSLQGHRSQPLLMIALEAQSYHAHVRG